MLRWIAPGADFPAVETALREPPGLLCAGASLAPFDLLRAYSQGIFPWYSEGQPILWWSTDPRMVLFPAEFKLARSLRKVASSGRFEIRFDSAFDRVIENCAAPRADGGGTWIVADMQRAYSRLHRLGFAHSVESWVDGELVGGLYGIALGRVFFGESMFTRQTDASKVAMVALVEKIRADGFALIDCQQQTRHLASLGARPIPRRDFSQHLRDLIVFDVENALQTPSAWTPPP